jgi:hypothetical protein
MRREMRTVIGGSLVGAAAIHLVMVACGSVSSEDMVADAQPSTSAVPAGAVMHFNLQVCPDGWMELAAARGRYLVGLTVGGTIAATVGTALTNTEDRPVGMHGHTVTDPGHGHGIQRSAAEANAGGSGGIFGLAVNSGTTVSATQGATTGLLVNSAGSMAGTNAPYLQLLVCQKS